MKIVKGDTVFLRSGKIVAQKKSADERHAVQGEVLRVLPEEGKVVVKGLNLVTKHQKPGATGGAAGVQQGGRIQMEAALPISRVMLVCPHCHKPTRVGMREQEVTRTTVTGSKTVRQRERMCKQCGNAIPRPTDERKS